MRKMIPVLAVSVMLVGCGTLAQKKAELVQPEVVKGVGEIVSMPSQLRTLNIKKKASDFLSCAEPGPDVALSDTFKLIAGVSSGVTAPAGDNDGSSVGKNVELNSDFQTSTTAMELAGRTQVVLLAREFMYRTCEAAANGWLGKDDVKNSHGQIIKQISSMVEGDAAKQKAKAAAAEVAAATAKKLDPKVVKNVADAIGAAVKGHCMTVYDSCVVKSGSDAKAKKACRGQLESCLN